MGIRFRQHQQFLAVELLRECGSQGILLELRGSTVVERNEVATGLVAVIFGDGSRV